MAKNQEYELLNYYINLLQECSLTRNEAESLLSKLYLFKKYKMLESKDIQHESFSLRSILNRREIILAPLLEMLERFRVLSIDLPKSFYSEVLENISILSDATFFTNLRKLQDQKSKGQFFTASEMIEIIYAKLFNKNDTFYNRNYTIIDFAAGIGDFIKPILNEFHFTPYAVEIDPISYEFMLFNFLLNPKINFSTKMRLPLTIRPGDALLGFNQPSFEILTSTINGKKIFKQYLTERLRILKSKRNLSIENIVNILQKRKDIASIHKKLADFNWYLDFPEIFFNESGKKLSKFGFDYVIGNPPWLGYGSFNHVQYEEIFSQPIFLNSQKGKFNFSLPFLILADYLTKNKAGLVIPQGIISETYASKWREKVFREQSLFELILCDDRWFEKVMNDFCIVFLSMKEKADQISIYIQNKKKSINVSYDALKAPLYKIPLIPIQITKDLYPRINEAEILENYCNIRRGLTLSKKYQNHYSAFKEDEKKDVEWKNLIRSNKTEKKPLVGIFNYQVYYDNSKFVYDDLLLGAPGSPQLFEQPKIIRRNRGRKWMIGMDYKGDLYVNDIFDIIIPKREKISLESLFGYLSSSFVQFLTESYIQRDINSNLVRQLPILKIEEQKFIEIEQIATKWFKSEKGKNETIQLRKKIDEIIFKESKIPPKVVSYIKNNVAFHWV